MKDSLLQIDSFELISNCSKRNPFSQSKCMYIMCKQKSTVFRDLVSPKIWFDHINNFIVCLLYCFCCYLKVE